MVLGHAESKSGLHFVLGASVHNLSACFQTKFVQLFNFFADLSPVNMPVLRNSTIFCLPYPILPRPTRPYFFWNYPTPGSNHQIRPTQHDNWPLTPQFIAYIISSTQYHTYKEFLVKTFSQNDFHFRGWFLQSCRFFHYWDQHGALLDWDASARNSAINPFWNWGRLL